MCEAVALTRLKFQRARAFLRWTGPGRENLFRCSEVHQAHPRLNTVRLRL
jgi:hypothetical protein